VLVGLNAADTALDIEALSDEHAVAEAMQVRLLCTQQFGRGHPKRLQVLESESACHYGLYRCWHSAMSRPWQRQYRYVICCQPRGTVKLR
jgi:hypothetical protein